MSDCLEKVGLDSNAAIFLIQSMSPTLERTESVDLDNQRLALLRSFIYQDDLFYLLPSVEDEYLKTGDKIFRHKLWQSGVVNFHDVLDLDKVQVEMRTNILKKYHGDTQDCHILAEAEFGGLSILVTYDKKFIKRLKKTTKVEIVTPTVYWGRLRIPQSSEPRRIPHHSNPLSKSSIWKL